MIPSFLNVPFGEKYIVSYDGSAQYPGFTNILINGLKGKTLAERISGLIQNGLITSDIGNKLDYYRRELNSASHTFQADTIEDDRNFSIDLIEYIFSKVAFQ